MKSRAIGHCVQQLHDQIALQLTNFGFRINRVVRNRSPLLQNNNAHTNAVSVGIEDFPARLQTACFSEGMQNLSNTCFNVAST